MRTRWEVFDPRDGRPLGTFRFRFLARLLCRLLPGCDYEREGAEW